MTAEKLRIGGLVGYALKAMMARFGVLLGLCAPALLIVIAAAVVGRLLHPENDSEGLSDFVVFISVATLVASVALVPAFTGWHRLLILGDHRRENGRALGWDRREWRYFLRMLQIWLAMVAAQLIIGIIVRMAGSQELAIAGSMLLLVIYLLIWAFIGLGLPAAALGDDRPLQQLTQKAEGNIGRIAVAIALVWICVGLIGVAFGAVLSLLGSALQSLHLIFVFGVMFYYVGMVASVGVLSRAYTLLLR